MKKTKTLAASALISGLAVVIMYIGSLFGKIDLATAAVCSFSVMFLLGRYGYRYAFCAYIAVSVLALIMLPSKTAPALFAAFFGYYPIVKIYGETRLGKALSWVLKYIVLNLAVIVLVFICLKFIKLKPVIVLIIFAAANLVLPFFDTGLSYALSNQYQFRIKIK